MEWIFAYDSWPRVPAKHLDIACENWRPWDPGFYAQGPDNLWDVWVMDVDGFRVLVVAQHFPGTPAEVGTQLRAMAESIRFAP